MAKSITTRFALALLPLLVVASSLSAQTSTTVRDLLALPDESVEALNAAGTDLTREDMVSLLTAHFTNDDGSADTTLYELTLVILTDPTLSGFRTWDDDRGGPGGVHINARDTAAASQGNAGMGMMIADGAWDQNATLDLLIGDVIQITGRVSFFGVSAQVSVATLELLGSYTDFGFDESIFAADTVSTSDLNMSNGDGTYMANWTNYPAYSGSYVCIDDATMFNRTFVDDREDWTVTSDGGETVVATYDMSLRYRNDGGNGAYTNPPFNIREDTFFPPPIGASVTLCGVMVHQGNNDPFFQASPLEAMNSIVPWPDSDLVVKASPPSFVGVSTPEARLSSTDPYTVTAEVLIDPERSADSVVLTWTLQDGIAKSAPDSTPIPMVNTEGNTWAADLPASGLDGGFVSYWVTATDNTGASTSTIATGYRTIDGPLASISDIQEAVLPGAGDYPSPFAGVTIENLTVIVQSQPAISGEVSVQDDSTLAPWSGIMLDLTDEQVATIAPGDQLMIASATVEERFGLTQLTDVTMSVSSAKSSSALGYRSVSSADFQDAVVREAHEGMLVTFENATITEITRFGEWEFTNASADETVIGDDQSDSFPGGGDVFTPGETYAFLQGIWWYSFGTYKIVPEDPDTDIGEQVNVAVEPIGDGIPSQFSLNQNYPNPFNPTTMITYDIPQSGLVTLEVFDITGRKLATLVDEELSAGSYRVSFDAYDLASGLYLYRLTAGAHVQTNKMLLMR